MLLAALLPARPVAALADPVLLHIDGTSSSYVDVSGSHPLLGAPVFSSYGRGLGARRVVNVGDRGLAALNGFPYGAFGLSGTDANLDGDYTDPGDTDPAALLAMQSDGAYNLAVSYQLGTIKNEAEIVRILQAAQASGIRLIMRATVLQRTTASGMVVRQVGDLLDQPDTVAAATTGDVYTLDYAATMDNLQR